MQVHCFFPQVFLSWSFSSAPSIFQHNLIAHEAVASQQYSVVQWNGMWTVLSFPFSEMAILKVKAISQPTD